LIGLIGLIEFVIFVGIVPVKQQTKKIETRRREEREGLLFESGTPADRALAGVTIRTKGSCPAGNKVHLNCGA
jgi:hypothetical protein